MSRKKSINEYPIETQIRDRANKLKARYSIIDREKFGVENNMDADWITENIINSQCTYCGESDWKHLGCDRIDNTKPHNKDNVVCSCGRCNIMRGDRFSVEEMKEIGNVIKQIEKRNTVYQIAAKRGKKVAKIDRNGEIVKIYPSTVETAIDGYNRSCVGKACNGNYKGDSNIYKGYYWKYL